MRSLHTNRERDLGTPVVALQAAQRQRAAKHNPRPIVKHQHAPRQPSAATPPATPAVLQLLLQAAAEQRWRSAAVVLRAMESQPSASGMPCLSVTFSRSTLSLRPARSPSCCAAPPPPSSKSQWPSSQLSHTPRQAHMSPGHLAVCVYGVCMGAGTGMGRQHPMFGPRCLCSANRYHTLARRPSGVDTLCICCAALRQAPTAGCTPTLLLR